MDDGLPERIRQESAQDEQTAHEGDSAVYTRVAMLCYSVSDTFEDGGFVSRQNALHEKIDLAYIRYAITSEQWGRLYDILHSNDQRATVTNGKPVYPSVQTATARPSERYALPERTNGQEARN